MMASVASKYTSTRSVMAAASRVGARVGATIGPAAATKTTMAVPFRAIHVERRLIDLGIELPKPAAARANYTPINRCGDMFYVSGHLPFQPDGTLMTGRIGDSTALDLDHGYHAARWAGLNIVATLQAELGDLDRVVKIVKLFGIVQSNEDFKEHHLVMDGCSDVVMDVFGKEVGFHARSAIGTNTLPLNMSVEVEAIVQVRD